MRRYEFLDKESVYDALNKLRAAFLAARNGAEVESIIKGILTHDEQMKVGRRIAIAQLLDAGLSYEDIASSLNVGSTTISKVERSMDRHPEGFTLINKREEKVEKEYKRKAYAKTGGSSLIRQPSAYTGFKRKDISR